jgi:hypothetical protein
MSRPEHFAAVVRRLFPTIEETPVTQPSPISVNTRDLTDDERGQPQPKTAEEHYRLGEALLAQSEAEVVNYARSYRLGHLAQVHYAAALADATIWPAPSPAAAAKVALRNVDHLKQIEALGRQVNRQQAIVEAARRYLIAVPAGSSAAGDQFSALAEAVAAYEATR